MPCYGKGEGVIEITWLKDGEIIGKGVIDSHKASSYKPPFTTNSLNLTNANPNTFTRSRRSFNNKLSFWMRHKRRKRESEYKSNSSNASTALPPTTSSYKCNLLNNVAQNSHDYECSVLPNGSLQLKVSNTSSNGFYQCIISNKFGSIISNRVQLLSLCKY